MNKSQLTKELADKWKITDKDAKLCIDILFEAMTNALAECGRVEIRGFGSFKVREYQSYTGRNPKTGKLVQVPKKKLAVFKTSSKLKRRISKKSYPA